MKFTQYLREQTRPERKASFIHLVKNDELWPVESNRLEDFEGFLRTHLEVQGEKFVPELRGLWRDYATQVGRAEGKHDLDLALAAWGDYAHHKRDCTGSPTDPCATEEDLFDLAMEASGFDERLERPALSCDGLPDEQPESLDELLEFGDANGVRDDGEWEQHQVEEAKWQWQGDDFRRSKSMDGDSDDELEDGEWEEGDSKEHEARC